MANKENATPGVVRPPKIIITGPTPMAKTPSSMTLGDTSGLENESRTDSDSMLYTADELAEQLANNSIDEYSPVQNCNQCEITIPNGVHESQQDLTTVEEGSEAIDPQPSNINSRTRGVFAGGFREFYYRCSDATGSKFAIIFWLLLMSLPISSGFMGARYLDECKLSPSTPALMFMMGITGIIMITIRIMIILHRLACTAESDPSCLHSTIVITYIFTLVLFATEIMAFWRYSPVFDIISPQYCNPTFYNFTYWMNCTVILVMLVAIILRIPKCLLPAESSN